MSAPDPLDRIAAWAIVVQYIDGQALRTPERRRSALDAVQSLKEESEALLEVARAARLMLEIETNYTPWSERWERLHAALARLEGGSDE